MHQGRSVPEKAPEEEQPLRNQVKCRICNRSPGQLIRDAQGYKCAGSCAEQAQRENDRRMAFLADIGKLSPEEAALFKKLQGSKRAKALLQQVDDDMEDPS